MMGTGYNHPSVEIEQERTVIQRRAGKLESIDKPAFIKLSTAFKQELPNISGDALKVWIFISLSINRKSGKANPGLRTISAGVKLAINTVQKCLVELENLQLLTVDRETARYNIYESPDYVSANRSEPIVSNGDTPPQTVSNFAQTVSNSENSLHKSTVSVILNQSNQKEPDSFSLSLLEIDQCNAKVDYILTNNKETWQGRELIRDNLLQYADWYNSTTGQVMTKRVQKSWWKALQDWQDEGLEIEHLQTAYDAQSKWRMVSDPNMLTKDACAIKAASKAIRQESDMVRLL
jgi:hypothetical protein